MCALCIVKSGALLYSEVNLHYRVWPPNYIVDSSDPALSEYVRTSSFTFVKHARNDCPWATIFVIWQVALDIGQMLRYIAKV